MKIFFSGGGTLGPVTPLLAIHDTIRRTHPEAEFLWIGTRRGVEKSFVESAGIRFCFIRSGKMRRYLSWWNITDFFWIVVGLFQSLKILWEEKPDACISAGGYVSVPVHWAAAFLRIPAWIHQQDVTVGLANKLMARSARMVTTALAETASHFSEKKVRWLGNPVRSELFSGNKARAIDIFHLDSALPTVLVMGGGTGSLAVNRMAVVAAKELESEAQIIHLTGKERPQEMILQTQKHAIRYHPYQFLEAELADAFAVADVVVMRGGFGSISEAAALAKAVICIPKPGHQEENVRALAMFGAVLFLDERTADGYVLAHTIRELLGDKEKREVMGLAFQKIVPKAREGDVLEIIARLLEQ